MLVLLRCFCATVSAFIFSYYMPNPAHLLYRLSPYEGCVADHCWEQWLWYDGLAANIRAVTIVLWMILSYNVRRMLNRNRLSYGVQK